ncbi:MAG: DNA repair protein RecO [Elusimicrobiales bacterium]
MILTDTAITLLRVNTRENDRAACVYTRTRGKLVLHFRGVNRHQGKLKAFAEPLSCAEHRYSFRPGALTGTAAGGKLITVFPGIRRDYSKLVLALHFCELLHQMTPASQPNPLKYDLLESALRHLDSAAAPGAMRHAFTLRLMALAGFGLDRPVLGIDREFWRKLHHADFCDLECGDDELEYLPRTETVLRRFFASQLNRPPNSLALIEAPPEPAAALPCCAIPQGIT